MDGFDMDNAIAGIQFWSLINSALSCAVLIYVVRQENRMTKVETLLEERTGNNQKKEGHS